MTNIIEIETGGSHNTYEDIDGMPYFGFSDVEPIEKLGDEEPSTTPGEVGSLVARAAHVEVLPDAGE